MQPGDLFKCQTLMPQSLRTVLTFTSVTNIVIQNQGDTASITEPIMTSFRCWMKFGYGGCDERSLCTWTETSKACKTLFFCSVTISQLFISIPVRDVLIRLLKITLFGKSFLDMLKSFCAWRFYSTKALNASWSHSASLCLLFCPLKLQNMFTCKT